MMKWLKESVLTRGMIRNSDLELFYIVDDPDELVNNIAWCEKEKCYDFPDNMPRIPMASPDKDN